METTEAQFDALCNIHLKGVFFLSQALLPLMNDGGRIINISSGLARFALPGYAVYGALKGGVETLTRYMAKELGPRGIAVNCGRPRARLRPTSAAAWCATTPSSTPLCLPTPRWAAPACRTTSVASWPLCSRLPTAG